MTSNAGLTVGQLIEEGAAALDRAGVSYGQGTLNAWDESRWLCLAALGLPVDSPVSIESQPVSAEQAQQARSFLARRAQYEPAAYITGQAWLKGYSFRVDPRVIIPRSFLAELILGGFSPWIEDPTRVRNILDLCTGSGCLAILAAKTFPSAQVTATDLSPEALEVARSNVADYGLGDRIRLLESDLFDRLSPAQDIDLILSNPPYVPSQRKKDLPKEFLREPEMALLTKDNGMALVRQILHHAGAFLSPNGLLAVEIGHEFQSCSRLIHAECPGLEPIWIETDEQRDNVFVIDAPSLNLHSWRPLK